MTDPYSKITAAKISLRRVLDVTVGIQGWRYMWENTACHTSYVGPFDTQSEAENAFRERVIREASECLE